jgi:hypothetical protein
LTHIYLPRRREDEESEDEQSEDEESEDEELEDEELEDEQSHGSFSHSLVSACGLSLQLPDGQLNFFFCVPLPHVVLHFDHVLFQDGLHFPHAVQFFRAEDVDHSPTTSSFHFIPGWPSLHHFFFR